MRREPLPELFKLPLWVRKVLSNLRGQHGRIIRRCLGKFFKVSVIEEHTKG
jgi:hypothetical protein